jgi:hypothetical protein
MLSFQIPDLAGAIVNRHRDPFQRLKLRLPYLEEFLKVILGIEQPIGTILDAFFRLFYPHNKVATDGVFSYCSFEVKH